MASRFPFDPANPGGQNNGLPPQMTNAQMRAVLGMPPGVDDLNVLYLEQQQRAQQEAQQRDMRYRQALYQERLDQQLQELQLRSTVAAQLEEYPDLQQHYRSLLLSEQIQRRNEQEQAFLRQQQSEQEQVQRALQAQAAAAAAAAAVGGGGGGGPLAAAVAAAAHQQQQQQQAAAAAQAAQIQAARLQYEEHLRRQQLQYQEQQQAAALQAARLHGIPLEAMSSVVGGTGAGIILANAAAVLQDMAPPLSLLQQQHQLQLQHQLQMQQQSLSRTASIDLSAAADTPMNLMINNNKNAPKEAESSSGLDNSNVATAPRKRRSSSLSGTSELNESQRSRKSRKSNRSSLDGSQGSSSRRGYRMSSSPIADADNDDEYDDDDDREKYEYDHDSDAGESFYIDPSGHALDQVALAAEMATPEIVRFGTILDILNIADEEEGSLDAAATLSLFKSTVEWSEDSEKEEQETEMEVVPDQQYEYDDSPGLEVPQDPAESLVTPMLTSYFPKLPEEPVFDEGKDSDDDDESDDDDIDKELEDYPDDDLFEKDKHSIHQSLVDDVSADGGTPSKEKQKAQRLDASSSSSEIISNVLEYPYPVDTWWPSTNGRRRERRQAGETSDEDRFDSDRESSSSHGMKPPIFRANEAKIRKRLATSLEPGVLEKLPHCRVHRLKKKSAIVSELVYCWQVTECYPNDLMVNCSRCGTWRHAACGGHYKPFSNRENIETPFVAVCENCHEEEKLTNDYARAQQRLQRQRMEHLRRGFATSSVMRNMSFSKHGGTYKWPLGSVSATHTGGHTRSVQARHDKAEKQWSDLATRLSRGYGYRAKERQRVRTKELERLLVSVEDAEGQTDRHNMLLFLMRDTEREVPVGYENYGRNLFDPDEPGMALEDEEPIMEGVVEDSTTTTTTTAASRNIGDDGDYQDTTTPGRIATGSSKAKKTANVPNDEVNSADADNDDDAGEEEDEGADDDDDDSICIHPNCTRKRRFDSVFCCDACGVSVLETDLLRSFHDSSNLHPSVLRSHY